MLGSKTVRIHSRRIAGLVVVACSLVFCSSGATSVPTPAAPSPKAMDLVREQWDPNGFPWNARWRDHVTSGVPPDPFEKCGVKLLFNRECSSEDAYVDEGRQVLFVCKPEKEGTYSGHINLRSVTTYTGDLKWKGWEPPFLDSDYGLHLVRADKAGQTASSTKGLKLEFDSRETVVHFRTPWWESFRQAVEAVGAPSYQQTIEKMINREAVVTGVLGLDCVHEFDAELHPVLAFAARVETSAGGELWALFVRERGNEGFCSQSKHRLPEGNFAFRLPWRSGMTNVCVDPTRTRIRSDPDLNVAVNVEYTPNDSISVTFPTNGAPEDFLVHGELALQWDCSPVVPASLQQRPRPPAYPVDLPDDLQEKLFDGSTDEVTVALRKELQVIDPVSRERSIDRKALRDLMAGIRRGARSFRLRESYPLEVLPASRRDLPAKVEARGRVRDVLDRDKEAYDALFARVWEAVRSARDTRRPGTKKE